MSITWHSTGDPIELHGPGSWLTGAEEPVADCGVLVTNGSGGFMLEGSPQELLDWMRDQAARLERLVASPPAPANGYIWDEHDNEIGDGCPHSGDPVSVDLDVDDESIACPARCPDSAAVEHGDTVVLDF